MKSLSLLCLLLGLFLAGCAAQSTFKSYYDARDLLERAKKLDPAHPFIPRAELELEAGRVALNEARYSRASRSFRLVGRDAEKVIMSRDSTYQAQFSDAAREESPDSAARWAKERQETPQDRLPEPAPSLKAEESGSSSERMKLPAEALARYLAQKKAPESVAKPAPAKTLRPAPKPKAPPPQPAPYPAAVAAAVADAPEVEDVEPDAEPSVEAASAPKDSVSASDHQSRKLSETLTFVPNEAGILPSARDELNRMSRFLMENPSTSLLLRPGVVPGEAESMLQARFEAIREYLEGKGVPADQVQLDSQKISATTPLFELHIIEH